APALHRGDRVQKRVGLRTYGADHGAAGDEFAVLQVYVTIRHAHSAGIQANVNPALHHFAQGEPSQARSELLQQAVAAVQQGNAQVLATDPFVILQARVQKVDQLPGGLHTAESAANDDEAHQPAPVLRVRL